MEGTEQVSSAAMKIKRRDFIQKSALGIGGVVLGAQFAPAVEAKPEYFDPYEKVTLGKTGLKFSRFCMGTGGAWREPGIQPHTHGQGEARTAAERWI
jgi:hypothetical protein